MKRWPQRDWISKLIRKFLFEKDASEITSFLILKENLKVYPLLFSPTRNVFKCASERRINRNAVIRSTLTADINKTFHPLGNDDNSKHKFH